jgi:hypothetical protein
MLNSRYGNSAPMPSQGLVFAQSFIVALNGVVLLLDCIDIMTLYFPQLLHSGQPPNGVLISAPINNLISIL